MLLDSTTPSIQYLCRKDKRLAKVIATIGPIECHTHADGYSFLIHEIIEQMLSTKAAAKIYARLEVLCGKAGVTPKAINTLTDEQIKNIGTSNSKVQYIRNITDAVVSGRLDLKNLTALPDKEALKQLTALKGIGTWTAKMYLIFVLNREDILPTEDVAFLQAYEWLYKTKDRSQEAVSKKCKKWKPYSSIAARYLYWAVDNGLCKEEFHLFK